MSLSSLSLNHHHAPLALRGALAFNAEQVPAALLSLHESLRERLGGEACEVALLSTCNRTELYLAGRSPESSGALLPAAAQWLAEHSGTHPSTLLQHALLAEDEATARHAFRVAAGLDSMVLGEPQILGQFKSAVRLAGAAGTLGCTLHQLFQRACSVAKEVRATTEIGAHAVSMPAAAVRLAQQLFGDIGSLRVLLVGAGEMIDASAAHFAGRKPLAMTVANRSLDRARLLAQRYACEAISLADMPPRLHEFDVVLTCTASTLPLIGLGAMQTALKKRRQRPMLVVDLAVPPDVEAEVAELDNAYLYTVDDLASIVQTGGDRRSAALQQAEHIVDGGVRGFAQWLEQRNNVPLIQAVKAHGETLQERALQRARRQMARGEAVESVLESLARGLTAQWMHGALSELNHSDKTQVDQLRATVARLFLRGPEPAAAPDPHLPQGT